MSFDFDLFVIGADSRGVRTARFAVDFGTCAAVVESRYLGGIHVNVGCMSEKLLVYGAHLGEDFEQARAYGWSTDEAQSDWATLIDNRNREIQRFNGVYRDLLVNSGVTLLEGHARLFDAHNVEVDSQHFSVRHILIATGGWPQVPDIPGKEHAIISNEAFSLERLSRRVLVVGGGYIAAEFASISNGFGAETTLLYRRDLFLRSFDRSVRERLRDGLGKKNPDLQSNSDITRIDKQADDSLAATPEDGRVLEADCVLYAAGQQPMLDNLGPENTGAKLIDRGFIVVNEHCQTSEPLILILGDVIGHVQLTPIALAKGMVMAWRLFKPEGYRPVDYKLVPTAVSSLSDIGTVGLTEGEALSAGHKAKVFESRLWPMKLTLTNDQEGILMKPVVDIRDDKALGCHMVGVEVGEIFQDVTVAMKAGATKQAFDETTGIHPTAAEKFVTLRTPMR